MVRGLRGSLRVVQALAHLGEPPPWAGTLVRHARDLPPRKSARTSPRTSPCKRSLTRISDRQQAPLLQQQQRGREPTLLWLLTVTTSVHLQAWRKQACQVRGCRVGQSRGQS